MKFKNRYVLATGRVANVHPYKFQMVTSYDDDWKSLAYISTDSAMKLGDVFRGDDPPPRYRLVLERVQSKRRNTP